ncbi:MAG: outer membrane beta-barrel protein [Terracidiphilus sp.]|jgi:outer membrane protein OmpA-like peptidoglycan-associated protein
MFPSVTKSISRFAALAILALLPAALVAQVVPAVKGTPKDDTASRWDIFVGYSYLSPHATDTRTDVTPNETGSYDAVAVGGIFSASYFFNRYVGLQAETGIHEWGSENSNPPGQTGTHGNNDGFTTVAGGLILRYPKGSWRPFVHANGGEALVDGPVHNWYTWGPSVAVGGGLDYKLSRHISIRLIQADYEYMHINFGVNDGGTVGINSERLSAGIVFNAGSIAPPQQVAVSCSANPVTIYPGDPVTVTATAGGLNPKLNTVYTWSGSGVTGTGETATVATAALAPGSYTVKCGVKEGKPGKEGLKPWESADSSAGFTVKAFEPPTISCSANPGTIKPGETSTITASGVSPQNRPLTYSYSATAGTVEGSGATVVFNSTGAPTGAATVTCNVSDDKGQTATANTNVLILAPYVAPAPHAQALCSLSFAADKLRPERVDNEAKACLDEVALELQKHSDAKVVLVGNSDAKEKAKTAREQKAALKNKHLKVTDPAAERAVNAKEYLVKEKGIDASRVGVVTGKADRQTVEDYLVPSGASFAVDVQGTTTVDESAVKAQVRKPLTGTGHKPAAGKPAAK